MEIKTKIRDYLCIYIRIASYKATSWSIFLKKYKVRSLLSLWTTEFFIEYIAWF